MLFLYAPPHARHGASVEQLHDSLFDSQIPDDVTPNADKAQARERGGYRDRWRMVACCGLMPAPQAVASRIEQAIALTWTMAGEVLRCSHFVRKA